MPASSLALPSSPPRAPAPSSSRIHHLRSLFEPPVDSTGVAGQPVRSASRQTLPQQGRRASEPAPPVAASTPPVRPTLRVTSVASAPSGTAERQQAESVRDGARHLLTSPSRAAAAAAAVAVASPPPSWQPPLRSAPAPALTSQKTLTNIKTSDAARAINDKLLSSHIGPESSSVIRKTRQHDGPPRSLALGPVREAAPVPPRTTAADAPPAIKDRFRHPARVSDVPSPEVTVPPAAAEVQETPPAGETLAEVSHSSAGTLSSLRTLVDPPTKLRLEHRKTSFATTLASASTSRAVSAATRPSLPVSASSGQLSTRTTDVPAFNVFKHDAKPLQLPLLDEYIGSLPEAKFSRPEDILGPYELPGWKEWLADAPVGDKSIWQKLAFWRKNERGAYARTAVADEADESDPKHLATKAKGSHAAPTSKLTVEQCKRALIFPPMHSFPPELTVTDLKHNRTSRAPLVTLNSILSTAIDAVLGAQGSSFAVSLMRVEVFRDLIQLVGTGVNFAIPPASGQTASSAQLLASEHGAHSPKTIILSVIPSVLGLDFVSAFGKAILWLWLFTMLCLIACWEFKTMVGGWGGPLGHQEDLGEGLDSEEIHIRRQMGWPTRVRKSRTYRICIIFLVTTFYLPLSKLSIGALAWTSDYWAVEKYYATSDNPSPDSLGPSETFRDPLDFCYTTTMRRDGFNWSYPILGVAIVTVLIVTIWFPIRLWSVVRMEVPKIDRYTELGEKRTDLRAEYDRLLERDRSPFSFVYNEYRREWAGFKSAYMALKLINVLGITLLTKDNCLFRNTGRDKINVIRQATLLGFMAAWMVLQIYARPFNNKLANNSDWCSRTAFVVIAILGLAAALKLPGKSAYSGWLLVLVTVVSYIFNGYYAAISTGLAQRIIKRWQHRLDFSLDIFSPHLDLPKHIARRIQQETISTLLLAEPAFRIKDREPLLFGTAATTPEDDTPPYLLAFRGTQGERHVENLKIMREVGLQPYVFATERLRDPQTSVTRRMQAVIQQDFSGPDCYWRPRVTRCERNCLSDYFGRATCIPFPPTIVFRYDVSNTTVSLTNDDDLAMYVEQNSATEVKAARRVRLALRALEGKRCFAPRREERPMGRLGRSMSVETQAQFAFGVLKIERNSQFHWRGYNYNSGFRVSLEYADGRVQRPDGSIQDGISLVLDAEAIGITPDFALTPQLAGLFRSNKSLLDEALPATEAKLAAHRQFFAKEAAWKLDALSYSFLIDVYGNDTLDTKALEEALARERDVHVRKMAEHHPGAFQSLRERMEAVNRETLCQWWYCAWDDIWRRNHNTITQLEACAVDFSPVYRTSICYRPMQRTRLEDFLKERGLWPARGQKGFFNPGTLNRIYFYLDQILFEGTRGGIPVKVGYHRHAVDFHELDQLKPFDEDDSFGRNTVLSYDTGHGTDHDESIIRNRPHFMFEEIYDERHTHNQTGRRARFGQFRQRAGEKIKLWLGLSPFERSNAPPGLYFGLRDSGGTYKAPRG